MPNFRHRNRIVGQTAAFCCGSSSIFPQSQSLYSRYAENRISSQAPAKYRNRMPADVQQPPAGWHGIVLPFFVHVLSIFSTGVRATIQAVLCIFSLLRYFMVMFLSAPVETHLQCFPITQSTYRIFKRNTTFAPAAPACLIQLMPPPCGDGNPALSVNSIIMLHNVASKNASASSSCVATL